MSGFCLRGLCPKGLLSEGVLPQIHHRGPYVAVDVIDVDKEQGHPVMPRTDPVRNPGGH